MRLFNGFLLLALVSINLFAKSDSEDGLKDAYPISNFHIVKKGELYRSAQLKPEKLEKLVREHGIRSIVNLRGGSEENEYFRHEEAVAERLGLAYFSRGISASHIPHRDELLWILNALESAPRPILIHCYAGADRTGLAVAIYAFDYFHASTENAGKHLSPRYLHLRWLYPAMDYFIESIYRGKTWARNAYEPCSQPYRYYNKSEFCRAPFKAE